MRKREGVGLVNLAGCVLLSAAIPGVEKLLLYNLEVNVLGGGYRPGTFNLELSQVLGQMLRGYLKACYPQ